MFNEPWIFDNAVLSNFARIDKIDLLFCLSNELYTTSDVLEEVERGIPKKPKLKLIINAVKHKSIKLKNVQNEDVILWMGQLTKEGVLGKGEISTMGLSKELNGIFITDDEIATKKARIFGIKTLDAKAFKGTVIILKILKEKEVISELDYHDIERLLMRENFLF